MTRLPWILTALLTCGGCGEDSGSGRAGDDADEEGAEGDPPTPQESCPVAPATTVPLLTGGGDVALHWPLDKGCLGVTYTAEAAPFLEQINEALAAWSAVECSRLCLEAPAQVSAEQDADGTRHRLRFTAGGELTRSTPQADGPTGVLVFGHVNIAAGAPPTTRSLIAAIGLLLGLGRPSAQGVDSVMHQTAASATPSAADADALCALYGTPGYCQD